MTNRRHIMTNRQISGIIVLNVKGIILKKINASFIVHFYLGKYSFSLDTSEYTLYNTHPHMNNKSFTRIMKLEAFWKVSMVVFLAIIISSNLWITHNDRNDDYDDDDCVP